MRWSGARSEYEDAEGQVAQVRTQDAPQGPNVLWFYIG
jgi:hypothetical protein